MTKIGTYKRDINNKWEIDDEDNLKIYDKYGQKSAGKLDEFVDSALPN